MSLWGELRRRNVFKVSAAYAVVGWLLAQIAATAFPVLLLPDWILRAFVVLLILGFPVAVVLAWAYEMTPEGVKPSTAPSSEQPSVSPRGRKLDFLIGGALVLALGFVVVDQYLLDDQARMVIPNSVAVLPFTNLSEDPEDAYFALGIHDEILNQLVKLRSLNVIARTSVMQYAGTQKTVQEIARELNVTAVMEGSIRYAEGSVLLTAQLIDGETNLHLWSESYQRDFSDIFAIQADIAMQVANALEAELTVSEQASIEVLPTRLNDAYRLYLRALSIPQSAAARRLLHEALVIDPDFGAAHARLAREYALSMIQGLGAVNDTGLAMEELDRLVKEHAGQALSRDLSLADAYLGLAWAHAFFWRWSEWLRADERLLEVSPNNADGIRDYALANRAAGRRNQAVQLAQRAVSLDPTAESLFSLAGVYRDAGNLSESIDAYRAGIQLNPNPLARLALGLVELRNGNSAELRDQLLALEPTLANPNPATVALFAYAHGRIGHDEDAMRLFNRLREMSDYQAVGTGSWVMAYLAIGDAENALDWIRRAVERVENHEPDEAFPQLLGIRHNSWGDPVLERPDFVEARSRITGE